MQPVHTLGSALKLLGACVKSALADFVLYAWAFSPTADTAVGSFSLDMNPFMR